jgi:hypothetical protein
MLMQAAAVIPGLLPVLLLTLPLVVPLVVLGIRASRRPAEPRAQSHAVVRSTPDLSHQGTRRRQPSEATSRR